MGMTNVIYGLGYTRLQILHIEVKLDASAQEPAARHHVVLLDEFHTAP